MGGNQRFQTAPIAIQSSAQIAYAMSNLEAVSAFVEGAPPGELNDVVADIKQLTLSEPQLVEQQGPAFEKYNEEQSASCHQLAQLARRRTVLRCWELLQLRVRSHNTGTNTWARLNTGVDMSQTASAVQSHVIEGAQADLV